MNYKLYTVIEVAELLQVTRRTVYNYIKNGQLKAIKFGNNWRVKAEELDRFITEATEDKED